MKMEKQNLIANSVVGAIANSGSVESKVKTSRFFRIYRVTIACVILLLLMGMFLMVSCSSEPTVSVVTDFSEVPQKIIEEAQNMPLEAGYYFFQASYAGESYIMICGEEGEAFDVQVDEVDYREGHQRDDRLWLNLKISQEKVLNTIASNQFSLPVVFLSIDNRTVWVSELECDGAGLELRGRRISEQVEEKDDGVEVRVIKNQSKIPAKIWDFMVSNDLERGTYEVFTGKNDLSSKYYIISGGDVDPLHCGLVIEEYSVRTRPVGGMDPKVIFELLMHYLYTATEPLPYHYTLHKPYIVLNIVDTRGMALEPLSPDGPLVFDDLGELYKKSVVIIK